MQKSLVQLLNIFPIRNGDRVVDMMKVTTVVAVVCVLLIPVMLWSDKAVENTSRRFANLTYCLWIVSHLHRYCVKKLMYTCAHIAPIM